MQSFTIVHIPDEKSLQEIDKINSLPLRMNWAETKRKNKKKLWGNRTSQSLNVFVESLITHTSRKLIVYELFTQTLSQLHSKKYSCDFTPECV